VRAEPVRPARFERQAGGGRHRVELIHRGPADGPRPQAHRRAVPELHELAHRLLRTGFGPADGEHHAVGGKVSDLHAVALVLGVRHEGLDDKAPTGHQALGDVAHGPPLRLGAEDAEERVDRHEHEAEWPARQLAPHVPNVAADPIASGLGSQPREHLGRAVERNDRQALFGERDGQAAGACAEFEHGAALGQSGERCDTRLGVCRGCVPVVVHIGEAVAVAGFVVAAHPEQ